MSTEKQHFEQSYLLTDRSIDEISDKTGEICNSFDMDSREIYRHRLMIEECLLRLKEAGNENCEVVLRTTSRFFQPYLEVSCRGEEYNPLETGNSPLGNDIYSNLGLVPQYYYDKGYNVLKFKMNRKRLSSFSVLALVVLISLVIGFGGKAILPDTARQVMLTFFISPLYDIFFNALRCLAGPMVFLAIAVGIYGIGDISTFGRIGRRMMLTYASGTLIFSAIGTLSFPFVGTKIHSTSSAGAGVSEIIDMFKNIVPSSVVTPFAEGNTLQIIFMAVVSGIAVLYLDKQAVSIARIIEQANTMIQLIMSTFCKAMPFFMVVIFIDIIWTGSGKQFSSTWILIAVGTAFSLLATILAITVFAMHYHIDPAVIFRKALPSYMIAIATASSTASFQSNLETCTEKYGVDRSIAGFGLPLGMIMSKSTASMYYVIVSLFMANQFNVSVSAGWLVIAVISCTLVTMAVPPVPGGGTCVFMVIFSQLGIPAEAISIAIAVELIMDHITTAGDVVLMPLLLTKAADSIGAVDRKVLAK